MTSLLVRIPSFTGQVVFDSKAVLNIFAGVWSLLVMNYRLYKKYIPYLNPSTYYYLVYILSTY